MQKVSLMRNKL